MTRASPRPDRHESRDDTYAYAYAPPTPALYETQPVTSWKTSRLPQMMPHPLPPPQPAQLPLMQITARSPRA